MPEVADVFRRYGEDYRRQHGGDLPASACPIDLVVAGGRPIALKTQTSSAQYEFNRDEGDRFWLYVVEYALEPGSGKILHRIQDPTRRSTQYRLDQNWGALADHPRTRGPSPSKKD
jgi:hypothetical protein